MEFFIKKIFEGKTDDLVHLQFQKFSRGEFKHRAMIIAKAGKEFRINTTPEFANEFVRYLAEMLGSGSTNVQGIVVSTRNLTGELDFQDKKQFMGVKQYVINKSMTGNQILDLCNKLPNSFIGLSFKVGETELNIKPKAPKSAKPSTKGESSPKVNFCKLKTNDNKLINSLIFDSEAKGFKQIEISHDFIINEIFVSDKLKKEAGDDFAKIKEMALKKGKIIRRLNIDGKEIVKEKEFES